MCGLSPEAWELSQKLGPLVEEAAHALGISGPSLLIPGRRSLLSGNEPGVCCSRSEGPQPGLRLTVAVAGSHHVLQGPAHTDPEL